MPVRHATPDDLPTIVALARQLFVEDSGTRDHYADVTWPSSAEGRRHYARHIARPDSCVLIAETSRIIGFLVGRVQPRNDLRPDISVADLEAMFVIAGDRSSGTGAALVTAFRAWASTADVDVLAVTASAANGRARRFYESLGFARHRITLEAPLSAAHDAPPAEPGAQ